jgi:hypothetical protein
MHSVPEVRSPTAVECDTPYAHDDICIGIDQTACGDLAQAYLNSPSNEHNG